MILAANCRWLAGDVIAARGLHVADAHMDVTCMEPNLSRFAWAKIFAIDLAKGEHVKSRHIDAFPTSFLEIDADAGPFSVDGEVQPAEVTKVGISTLYRALRVVH
jgi:diacylglycerol kinase family enzyme